jgi:hypothetical protein
MVVISRLLGVKIIRIGLRNLRKTLVQEKEYQQDVDQEDFHDLNFS